MTSFDSSKLSRLADIIQEKSVVHGDDTTRIMDKRDGRDLTWLIDLRPVMMDSEALDIISDLFWDHYQDKGPVQIGGMEVAAVPLVTALIMKARQRGLDANGFLIRKDRKTYGLGKLIEGELNAHPVILVDDIMNSGNSLEKAWASLIPENLTPSDVFVVIDYDSKAGHQWRAEKNVPVVSLFNDISRFGVSLTPPVNHIKFSYKILWRYYKPGAFAFNVVPKSTPLLVGDRIYMGTEKATMVCINRLNGELIWEYETKTAIQKGIWSSPQHHHGRIYFGNYNGVMFCLNAQDGSLIWKNPCCDFIGSTPLLVPKHNLLYIGLESQRPRMKGGNAALRMDTGERIWEVGQKKYQHGSAAYYEPQDSVIFGNADHDLTAYEAKTGKLIWKHDTVRSHKYPPAIDLSRKRVVSTSFDGNIYILNAETGERLAAIQTDDICYTTPLVTHNRIYAGSGDKFFYVINSETLEVEKKINCYARIYSSPRLMNGHVVFGTNGGQILELDPETLQIVGKAQVPDSVTNAVSMSPDGKIFYASTHMNEIYAIEREPISTALQPKIEIIHHETKPRSSDV